MLFMVVISEGLRWFPGCSYVVCTDVFMFLQGSRCTWRVAGDVRAAPGVVQVVLGMITCILGVLET